MSNDSNLLWSSVYFINENYDKLHMLTTYFYD